MSDKKETPIDRKEIPSIKKDWFIAIGGFVLFVLLIKVAGYVTAHFETSAVYDVVDVSSIFAKVAIASALAWSVQKFIFPATLGKDFGGVFNIGWGDMSAKEKTRWILGVFMALFITIMLAGSGATGQ